MRTLISSLESDSKRFTLESSSTSSSSRIVGCSSLIRVNPLCLSGSFSASHLRWKHHPNPSSVSLASLKRIVQERIFGGTSALLRVLELGGSVAHLTNFRENPFYEVR